MNIETIGQEALVDLAMAGAVVSAHAVRLDGGWEIIVSGSAGKFALAMLPNPKAHVFAELDAVAEFLSTIGVSRFQVDADLHAASMDLDSQSGDENMDEAARSAYDEWLKAEVQEAIDDERPTVPHDEAMRRVWAAIRRS